MRVGFLGLGRLGLPVSCAMVQKGHEVFGYDVDPAKIASYRSGVANLYEPDIDKVLTWALGNGLHICSTVKEAVGPAEIVFIAVPTPSRDDDAFDTSYVKDAVKDVADVMQDCLDYKVVSVISTVLPGTTRNEFLPVLVDMLGEPGPQTFGLCYNAQFIAMGTTIDDMLNPEFVLIGQLDEHSGDVMGSFYSQLVTAPLLRMSMESAEMVKMSYNTMIGFKIVFANTIMELCDKIPFADCDVVSGALCKANKRLLSPRYMRGGMGDGGGCFPPGEIVITEDGPKPIEKVLPGELVLTVDGSLQKVLGCWERDYDGHLMDVPVRGLPGTTLTTDHRMIVAGDGRTKYTSGKRDTRYTIQEKMKSQQQILARALTSDYLIPFPVPYEQVGLAKGSGNEHVCAQYLELAGWYLSEGWATSSVRRGRVGFALHEDEMDIARRIGELCVLLDPPTEGRRKDVKVSISQKDGSKGIMIRYGSKRLARLLIQDFGKGAQGKKIPAWVVYGPICFAEHVMKGLWQGDGYTDENGMALSTTSQNIAWSTLLILSRMDIPATLKETPERTGKDGQKHKKSYEVRVRNKQYIEKMAEITGLPDETKEQDKLYELYPYRDQAFWRHVQGLSSRPYKGKVYNLWVDGNNTYVTGCGAVHNCHPRDNRALSWLAESYDLSADPFDFVMRARGYQSGYLSEVVHHYALLKNLPVVILGRTFKPETNLTLDSPAFLLGDQLVDRGIIPLWHDPIIGPFEVGTPGPCIYFVATRHAQYKDFPYVPGSVIIDPWRYIPDVPGCEMIRIGSANR